MEKMLGFQWLVYEVLEQNAGLFPEGCFCLWHVCFLHFSQYAGEKEMATHSSFLSGESQGQGSLVGCRLWGRTELDTTEATQQQQGVLSKILVTFFNFLWKSFNESKFCPANCQNMQFCSHSRFFSENIKSNQWLVQTLKKLQLKK